MDVDRVDHGLTLERVSLISEQHVGPSDKGNVLHGAADNGERNLVVFRPGDWTVKQKDLSLCKFIQYQRNEGESNKAPSRVV